jgi:hypothetical protein
MTEKLHRLVYYSRNRVTENSDVLAREISSILKVSRVNNERLNVTGALMFNSGCFAQVLEGPRLAIENTFERIQQDSRHGDVSLLAFEPAPDRAFRNWSMGFIGASVKDAARYGLMVQETGYDPAQMTGDALLETLHRLALEEEGEAAAA